MHKSNYAKLLQKACTVHVSHTAHQRISYIKNMHGIPLDAILPLLLGESDTVAIPKRLPSYGPTAPGIFQPTLTQHFSAVMARTPSADFLERQAASMKANTVSICCSLARNPNPRKRATDYLEDGLTYKHAYILEAISLRRGYVTVDIQHFGERIRGYTRTPTLFIAREASYWSDLTLVNFLGSMSLLLGTINSTTIDSKKAQATLMFTECLPGSLGRIYDFEYGQHRGDYGKMGNYGTMLADDFATNFSEITFAQVPAAYYLLSLLRFISNIAIHLCKVHHKEDKVTPRIAHVLLGALNRHEPADVKLRTVLRDRLSEVIPDFSHHPYDSEIHKGYFSILEIMHLQRAQSPETILAALVPATQNFNVRITRPFQLQRHFAELSPLKKLIINSEAIILHVLGPLVLNHRAMCIGDIALLILGLGLLINFIATYRNNSKEKTKIQHLLEPAHKLAATTTHRVWGSGRVLGSSPDAKTSRPSLRGLFARSVSRDSAVESVGAIDINLLKSEEGCAV